MKYLILKINITLIHLLSNLSQSSHHRYPMMKYTGDYADIDITDRKFPHFPTYV